jgi:hypothetical protein
VSPLRAPNALTWVHYSRVSGAALIHAFPRPAQFLQ